MHGPVPEAPCVTRYRLMGGRARVQCKHCHVLTHSLNPVGRRETRTHKDASLSGPGRGAGQGPAGKWFFLQRFFRLSEVQKGLLILLSPMPVCAPPEKARLSEDLSEPGHQNPPASGSIAEGLSSSTVPKGRLSLWTMFSHSVR